MQHRLTPWPRARLRDRSQRVKQRRRRGESYVQPGAFAKARSAASQAGRGSVSHTGAALAEECRAGKGAIEGLNQN